MSIQPLKMQINILKATFYKILFSNAKTCVTVPLIMVIILCKEECNINLRYVCPLHFITCLYLASDIACVLVAVDLEVQTFEVVQ